MTIDSIFPKVCDIIIDQLGLSEEDVQADSILSRDLGADSLDFIEFILAIEEEFQTDIPEVDAEKFVNVQDVVDYLTEKVG